MKLPLRLLSLQTMRSRATLQEIQRNEKRLKHTIFRLYKFGEKRKGASGISKFGMSGSQMAGLSRNADQRSKRLNGTAEVRKSWRIPPELDQNLSNQCNLTRENSLDSQRSEIDYDKRPRENIEKLNLIEEYIV